MIGLDHNEYVFFTVEDGVNWTRTAMLISSHPACPEGCFIYAAAMTD